MVKTEHQIWEAMISLLEEKPLSKIKVTQLTERAGISRSTFYTYYDSIYDVVQAIEDDFLTHLTDERDVKIDADSDMILRDFSYVRDHLRTYEALTGPGGDPSFNARIKNRSHRILTHIAEKSHSSLSETQLTMIDEYAFAGKMQIFRWWGEHEEEVSVKEVVEIMGILTDSVHNAVKNTKK